MSIACRHRIKLQWYCSVMLEWKHCVCILVIGDLVCSRYLHRKTIWSSCRMTHSWTSTTSATCSCMEIVCGALTRTHSQAFEPWTDCFCIKTRLSGLTAWPSMTWKVLPPSTCSTTLSYSCLDSAWTCCLPWNTCASTTTLGHVTARPCHYGNG